MSGADESRVPRRPRRRPRRRRHVVRLALILLAGVVVTLVVTGVAWWRLPHATLVDGTSLDPDAAACLLAHVKDAPDDPIAERWRSWGLTVIEAGGRYDLGVIDPTRPPYAAKGSITVHDAAVRVSFGWPWRCVYFERYSLDAGYRSAIVIQNLVRNNRIGRRRRTTDADAKIPIWRGHLSRPWGAVVPIGVQWGGMIGNVLAYALGLWLVGRGIRATHRAIRRWRGRCPACGYLRGVSPVCTECGATLTASEVSADALATPAGDEKAG